MEIITLPGTMSTIIPNACGITRMSEKIIDASRANRFNGCIVTSHANSGVRQMVKKSFCFRTAYKRTTKLKLECERYALGSWRTRWNVSKNDTNTWYSGK